MMKAIHILCMVSLIITSNFFAQVNPKSMKRNAVMLMKEGNYGEAINQWNKYISAVPREPEGYHLRALCFEQRGNYPYAVLDLRRSLKLDGSNQEVQSDYSRIISDWHAILKKEIEGYKREIAINPDQAFNYLEIGKRNSHLHLEDYPTAEYWYDEYLARDDDASPDEIIRYTLILQETGHIVKGEKILKKYTERYPEDWRIWSRYGFFTLWLGKYKVAENAFRTALSFKPFFKEAQDGLDLAIKEGYVTQYQGDDYDNAHRRAKQKEYPIDRYYRLIKNNPEDDESRFALVEELIKVGRYEEAHQQAQILRVNYEDDEKFIALNDEIDRVRAKNLNNKIESATLELMKDPTNAQAAMDIAKYYSSLNEYDEATEILTEFLDLVPENAEAHYLLSKIYSYSYDYENAIPNALKAVELDGSNINYKLFAGQLLTWNGDYSEQTQNFIQDVLDEEPDNFYALITLGTLNLSQNKIDETKEIVDKLNNLDPDNPDVQTITSRYETMKLRLGDEEMRQNLDIGRQYAVNKDYESAIPYYSEFMDNVDVDRNFKMEFADIYIGNEDYSSAIELYNSILNEDENDYQAKKQRAKLYFWNGDSSEALDEFEELSRLDPEDLESRMYLGDSYTKFERYDEAEKIYKDLLVEAPDSYMIQQRLDWLPKNYNNSSLFDGMMSYINLDPYSYYFNDNLDFEYMYYGLGGEIGLFRSVSLGGTYSDGYFGNSFGRIRYSTFKGTIYVRPMKNFVLSANYGRLKSLGIYDEPIWGGTAEYNKKNDIRVAFTYDRSVGVAILYSPTLVGHPLTAHNLRLDVEKNFKSTLRIEGYYQFIITDRSSTIRQNIGNTLNLKLSKKFYPDVRIGYEFEFTDYKIDTPLYWTPNSYSHHALWSEWDIIKDNDFNFLIGGKIGYVPKSDFVLRAAWAEFGYKILPTLRLVASGYIGSSVQNIVGYSSGSFMANLFWTIY